MKALVISLGCKVNQSEGEEILDLFAAAGAAKATPDESADIIIVNTCTVTGEADRKSRKLIYRAIETKKAGCHVVVTGCYAETAADKLRGIPGVDLVVPQSEKDGLVERVLRKTNYYSSKEAQADESRISGSRLAQKKHSELARTEIFSTSMTQARHRVYLKIQDGCDNRCAYCIVPDARGKARSVPPNEILSKVAGLSAGGTKEIILTGINVGKFGTDEVAPSQSEGAPRLPAGRQGKAGNDGITRLIKRLMQTPGLERIRLSSIEPEDVTEELVEILKTGGERHPHLNPLPARERQSNYWLSALSPQLTEAYLCPHLHIPLQSGDDETLKRMRRRYTADGYRKTIKRIRVACPDAAITTDVIVGFPGETDEEFRNTYRFIEEIKPARLHVFRYSKRAGTPAADMPGQVTAAAKAERSEALRELSGRLEADYRKMFVGRELEILVEKASGGRLTGTSENYLTVTFNGDDSLIGKLVRTRLLD
ncbi:MAG: MiaB/RimO family radical SAM methylthiotransferase [Actinomycetota bacterium]